MWVVKLGGSLAFTPELSEWLLQLASHGAGRVVIVPGGGVFADLVRTVQTRARCGDNFAHRMALRGMDQYGLLLCGMELRLQPVSTVSALDQALAEHRVPVWLPSQMLDDRSEIESSWDVTADSLAAWFAADRQIRNLLLVKSVALGTEPVLQQELVRREVLDPAFPRYRDPATEVRCVNSAAHRWVPQYLSGAMSLGALVLEH